jgi:hypothetical protein
MMSEHLGLDWAASLGIMSFGRVRPESCQGILDEMSWTAYVKKVLTKDVAMPASARKSPLSCSFCGKSETEISRLLGGPGVHICDACVGVCNNILAATPTDFAGWDKMSDPDLLAALKNKNVMTIIFAALAMVFIYRFLPTLASRQ